MMLFSKVDVHALVFKDATKTPAGGQHVFIDTSATNRASPQFQLAEKMRVPFGIRSASLDGTDDGPRKNMEVSVDDEDVQAFLRGLDERVLQEAADRSKEWFKKKLTVEQVATLFRPSMAQDDAGKFAPLLRIKVNADTAKRPPRVFVATPSPDGGMKYLPGTLDDCPPQSHVTPVVELGGVWLINKGCGITFTCTDLLVYPASTAPQAFPFQVTGDFSTVSEDGGTEASMASKLKQGQLDVVKISDVADGEGKA